jgi:hypothetical protein
LIKAPFMTVAPTRFALLLGAAFVSPLATPAAAQQPQPTDQTITPAPAPSSSAEAPPSGATAQEPATNQPSADAAQPSEEEGDEEEIVVTGQRARGSVIGDIPPENTLDSRDVRATGATNMDELLAAIAPQIGSGQGRGGEQPVLLLNGQRISSYREMRDIPPEAISRVEILPEEVALKYGYRADQKVVNIVLRPRFRATTAQLSGNAATEGGYKGGFADLTQMRIQNTGRDTYNLRIGGNDILTESERDIAQQDPNTPEASAAANSLVPSAFKARGNATINRTILGDVSATFNGELEHDSGHALTGLSDQLLSKLDRNTKSDSAHLGTALNWDRSNWRYSVTGNFDWDRDVTDTERDDPVHPEDRARSTSISGDLTGTANGNLFRLPAGTASTTVKVGVTTQHLDSKSTLAGVQTSDSLGRTTGSGSVNIDLPISRRNRDFSALGNLTLNANAEVDHLSDAGTLTTIGAGANWSPVDRLNFVTSWTREEGAPTVQQLGNPLIETPDTRIFDFVTGETVRTTVITGGNPELTSDRRNVFKVGANWQPFEKTDLRLRAEYVHQKTDNTIGNISVSPTFELAFPDRFLRDASGRLLSVDLRPVNFESSQLDTLRVGFDFTKPLKSRRPSQSFIEQIRQRAQAQGIQLPSDTPPGARPGGGGGRDRGFGGGGSGRGGFGSRGRLTFSLTDTITFVDEVTIGPGLPKIDYLHGDPQGQTGGQPRHVVQAQAGYYNNGWGARLGANWRSATDVNTLTDGELHFSPLATFDLRVFANLGEQFGLVEKHPWLRGSSVRFEVSNLFDSKPRVRDSGGNTPVNFQPDLLDPLGRTVMISFRKQFLPASFYRREFRRAEERLAPPPPSGAEPSPSGPPPEGSAPAGGPPPP